jgi:hypothetical protein
MVFGGDKRDRDGETKEGGGAADSGFLIDVIRRAVQSGVQAVFSSEEGRRNLVGALMPRELIHTVMQQIDSSKREAVAMVGREMQQFLSNLNVGQELTKILTSVTFEIKTEVRFIPNEDGTLRSDVQSSVRPHANPDRVQPKARKSLKTKAKTATAKAESTGKRVARRLGRAAAKAVSREGDPAGDPSPAAD